MPEQSVVQTQGAPAGEDGHRGGLLAASAAVLAAIGASLCCVGPILFVTLGVGAGLASTFEPLRPVFTVLTILGLGFGFYTVYGRPARVEACAPGEACARPRTRRDKILLWSAVVLAALFWSFPFWSILLV
ncbi:hypothetical protein BH23GEM7_BH23GEM7_20810 [soil metagenome]|jgi:mercuric ion transport protein|nr:hypothetical protein [Gemmatimonadota bacterium]